MKGHWSTNRYVYVPLRVYDRRCLGDFLAYGIRTQLHGAFEWTARISTRLQVSKIKTFLSWKSLDNTSSRVLNCLIPLIYRYRYRWYRNQDCKTRKSVSQRILVSSFFYCPKGFNRYRTSLSYLVAKNVLRRRMSFKMSNNYVHSQVIQLLFSFSSCHYSFIFATKYIRSITLNECIIQV